MASSSLLPALWLHGVTPPPSLLPPPPLGALPPQPASTSTATSATTLVHARGLGLCHLTKVPPFHCTQLLEPPGRPIAALGGWLVCGDQGRVEPNTDFTKRGLIAS